MGPVQALAILSLGAFVTVLVTAIFYVFTVRPRLLEPVSLANTGLLDESLREELLEQRVAVGALNKALAQHTARLDERVAEHTTMLLTAAGCQNAPHRVRISRVPALECGRLPRAEAWISWSKGCWCWRRASTWPPSGCLPCLWGASACSSHSICGRAGRIPGTHVRG